MPGGEKVGCAEGALIAAIIILLLVCLFAFLLVDTSNLSRVLQSL